MIGIVSRADGKGRGRGVVSARLHTRAGSRHAHHTPHANDAGSTQTAPAARLHGTATERKKSNDANLRVEIEQREVVATLLPKVLVRVVGVHLLVCTAAATKSTEEMEVSWLSSRPKGDREPAVERLSNQARRSGKNTAHSLNRSPNRSRDHNHRRQLKKWPTDLLAGRRWLRRS